MSKRTLIFLGVSGNLATKLLALVKGDYEQIIGFDINHKPVFDFTGQFDFLQGDFTDAGNFSRIFDLIKTGNEVHVALFASLLSGGCEKDRDLAVQVNVLGAQRVLQQCAERGVKRVLFPSSLAIFGAGEQLPNPLPENYSIAGLGGPSLGLYGLTKRWVMDLGGYYTRLYGMDFRSAVLPMVLSPEAPSGAASAYASRAFVEAINGNSFTFPVSPDTGPSLVFVDDAVDALAKLLLADSVKQSVYQVHGFTGTANDIASAISAACPGFSFDFQADPTIDSLMRSWPKAMLCNGTRNDLGWQPQIGSLAEVFNAFRAKMGK